MPELPHLSTKNHTGHIRELLDEFYDWDVPGYVAGAGKTFMKLRVQEWDGSSTTLKITLNDVVDYYRTQAPNLSSGMRTLAGYANDWRPIDKLAHECLEWFKYVNIQGLRTASRNAGLEPRF